ncbi:MAG: hypothetical protein R3185_03605, partial [Candidatus Thermoplasmatota archaeon]|nr:hypothetical protein [Candidatus Thermoplasmatota archaeon]
MASSLLLAPSAHAQATRLDVTAMEATPLVLPPSGGEVTLGFTARGEFEVVQATVRLSTPSGAEADLGTTQLVITDEDPRTGAAILTGTLEFTLGDGEPDGWWTATLVRAEEPNGTGDRLDLTGETSATFLLHPDTPVAGRPDGPAWPQYGGDGLHAGRSLATGP